MAGKEGYWLMDGRANYDVDAAIVLECCDILAEAKRNINDYGADTCIVDAETQEVVDSLMWRSPTPAPADPYTEAERQANIIKAVEFAEKRCGRGR
jgi:uncharacterized membrane protein